MTESKRRSGTTYPLQSSSLFQSSQSGRSAPSRAAAKKSSAAYSDQTNGEAAWLLSAYPLQKSPRQSLQHNQRPFSPDLANTAPNATHSERAANGPQAVPATYPLQASPPNRSTQAAPSALAWSARSEVNASKPHEPSSEARRLPHSYPLQAPWPQSLPHGNGPSSTKQNGTYDTELKAPHSAGTSAKSSERPVSYPMQAPLPLPSSETVFASPARRSEASSRTAVSSGRATQELPRLRHPYPSQISPPGLSQGNGPFPPIAEKTESKAAYSLSDSASELPRLPRNIRALRDGKGEKVLGRTIVICLDGTGDKFDADNSNIIHLVSCLKKSDPSQITYYQSGIGTYDGGGLSNGANAALDMAIGSGLGVHIRDAYHFLMQNYEENDRICLFGFSRGAYTARCLAGMVHKVGLLPAHNIQQIPFAYEYYKDDTEEGWKMSGEFKRTFCMNVSIHFIGVFDSVASVGFIPRTLPLSSTPWNKATYFRHAMALDEHRAKFKVKQFERKDSISTNSHWETVAEIHEDAVDGHPATKFEASLGSDKYKHNVFEEADDGGPIEEDLYLKHKRLQEQAKQTDVLEVWFTGAHSDVGGGAVANEKRHKLAQIPLRWMLRQCFECNTGIIFKVHRLAEEGLDVHTLWPTYRSLGVPRMGPGPSMMEKHKEGKAAPISRRSRVLKPVDKDDPQGLHDVLLWKDEQKKELHDDWVPEHVEDYFDSIADINDQLVAAKAWWILEVWPVKVRVQLKDSEEWVKKVTMNLGRYRAVQESSPNLHWTVQQRIEAMGYKMNVRLDKNASWNVVA